MSSTPQRYHPPVRMGLAGLAVLVLLLAGGVAVWRSDERAEVVATEAGRGRVADRDAAQRSAAPERYRQLLARLEAAAADAGASEVDGQGLSAFHRIAGSLESADFAALLESGQGSAELRLKVLLAWAERDPRAAAEALARLGQIPPEASAMLAGTWARQDLEAALGWGRGLPAGAERDGVLLALAGEAALKDPRVAIELLGDLESCEESRATLVQAAGAWGGSDREAAAAWARGLEEPGQREAALAAIATAWADRDPHGAAALVLESVGDGSIEENSIVGIVQRFAFRDPQAAREWVEQFPTGRTRERAEAELQRVASRAGR